MKYYWIGCLNIMVLQCLYKNGSHPTCHLVHTLFKLNVQDLLYVNLIAVYRRAVLGPLLYVLHTSPVADIIKRHNLTYHLYADDTQLYVSFKLGSDDLLSSAKASIEICVQEINNWMILNGLKLNEEKTELLLLSSRCRRRPSLMTFFIRVGGETVQPSSSVHNLGVILDPSSDTLERFARHVISI